MTIVGVSDESPAKVRAFLAKTPVKYLIAIGGAAGYATRGIPHAWLVNPKQEIVWKGHPASLTRATIEKHLEGVYVLPTFALPRALTGAQRFFGKGRYGAGLRSLERYLKDAKSDEVAAQARAAVEKLTAYTKGQLADAARFVEEREYARAIDIVTQLEAAFKGSDVADTAKAKRLAWMQDDTIKAELAAADLLAKARAFRGRNRIKSARALLKRIVNSTRYEGTKAHETAKAALAALPGGR